MARTITYLGARGAHRNSVCVCESGICDDDGARVGRMSPLPASAFRLTAPDELRGRYDWGPAARWPAQYRLAYDLIAHATGERPIEKAAWKFVFGLTEGWTQPNWSISQERVRHEYARCLVMIDEEQEPDVVPFERDKRLTVDLRRLFAAARRALLLEGRGEA